MKFFIILFLSSIFVYNYIECIQLKCNYVADQWDDVGPIYSCQAWNQSESITSRMDRTINKLSGSHQSSKSNSDVTGVNIQYSKIYYFPLSLHKFFINLKGIWIQKTELKEVRQSDLKEFKNLKILQLKQNQIEVLEADLFKFNSKLEIIFLESNKISHINPSVFNIFKNKLTYLYLSDNICELGSAQNSTAKANLLILNIQTGSCKDENKLAEFERNALKVEATTSSTTKFSTYIKPQTLSRYSSEVVTATNLRAQSKNQTLSRPKISFTTKKPSKITCNATTTLVKDKKENFGDDFEYRLKQIEEKLRLAVSKNDQTYKEIKLKLEEKVTLEIERIHQDEQKLTTDKIKDLESKFKRQNKQIEENLNKKFEMKFQNELKAMKDKILQLENFQATILKTNEEQEAEITRKLDIQKSEVSVLVENIKNQCNCNGIGIQQSQAQENLKIVKIEKDLKSLKTHITKNKSQNENDTKTTELKIMDKIKQLESNFKNYKDELDKNCLKNDLELRNQLSKSLQTINESVNSIKEQETAMKSLTSNQSELRKDVQKEFEVRYRVQTENLGFKVLELRNELKKKYDAKFSKLDVNIQNVTNIVKELKFKAESTPEYQDSNEESLDGMSLEISTKIKKVISAITLNFVTNDKFERELKNVQKISAEFTISSTDKMRRDLINENLKKIEKSIEKLGERISLIENTNSTSITENVNLDSVNLDEITTKNKIF